MKLLDGRELAAYIKERQAKQVRGLRQAWQTVPRLAIIITTDNPVIETYVRLKRVYGEDILVEVDVHHIEQTEAAALIDQLNADDTVHGIIIQLPLADTAETDALVARVAPEKDVDGLGPEARHITAAAVAVDWLLAGYGVSLKDKKIALVGKGRLVGMPLLKLWEKAGLDVTAYDKSTGDLKAELRRAGVIVTAAGASGIITSDMVSPGTVVVDAGTTASENGVILGDVAPEVRERQDLTITPEKGGVSPLTIAALFDNVINSARASASQPTHL